MKVVSHKNEQGATLIVVLVILVAMTFLGLGSMSDANLQLAMVRNSQMQTNAYTVALTEIDAQLDAVNTNTESDVDQIILNLVQVTPDSAGFRSTNPAKLLPGILGQAEADMAYTTTLVLAEPNANVNPPIEDYTISTDSTIKWMLIELQSAATVRNTNTASNQTQGFRYLSAN